MMELQKRIAHCACKAFVIVTLSVSCFMAIMGFTSSNTKALAHAHGLGYAMVQDRATTLRFYYSDDTPACFAEATVFDPDGSEFLIARTDARGYFSFIPDRTGIWNIELNDGMGHRAMASLVVDAANMAMQGPLLQGQDENHHEHTAYVSDARNAIQSYHHSKALMAIFGVSLLANLGLGITLYRRRKTS